MRWQSQQHGLERYNCADSLDRTNAASYFGAVQVTADLFMSVSLRPAALDIAQHAAEHSNAESAKQAQLQTFNTTSSANT